jgi:hypothetical protein
MGLGRGLRVAKRNLLLALLLALLQALLLLLLVENMEGVCVIGEDCVSCCCCGCCGCCHWCRGKGVLESLHGENGGGGGEELVTRIGEEESGEETVGRWT